jgi:hypothetical protein
VARHPDGELRFRRPDGRPLPEVPPPPAIPADPVQALRARHDAQGLRIHARTATPGWLGEPLDVGYAIGVLHPLAVGPSPIPSSASGSARSGRHAGYTSGSWSLPSSTTRCPPS